MKVRHTLSVFLSWLLLAGCAPRLQRGFKVGLVTDVGGLNDQGFNSLAYQGLLKAKKKLHIMTNVIESHQATDYEKNLQEFADAGYNVIVSVGFMMGDATEAVAKRYPHSKFIIVDYKYQHEHPNIEGITFAEEQSGFLAGALAALVSKTHVVGFVGGMDVPVIHRFKIGYEDGARAADPTIKVLSAYTGSFQDSAKGREVAAAEYDEGADICFQAAGASGLGVIDAAKDANKLAIGVDADQHAIAPHHVLSSALKNVNLAVYHAIVAAKAGHFAPGNTRLTLKDGAVGLAPYYDLASDVSPAAQKQIETFEQEIETGKIKIKLPAGDRV